MTLDTLYTAGDAAKFVGDITAAGIKKAAATGKLHVAARTVGGIALFSRRDVESFKAERAARMTAGLARLR